MTKWINFYRPFFTSDDETKTLVRNCEELAPDVTVRVISVVKLLIY